jgi:hypothetical protein
MLDPLQLNAKARPHVLTYLPSAANVDTGETGRSGRPQSPTRVCTETPLSQLEVVRKLSVSSITNIQHGTSRKYKFRLAVTIAVTLPMPDPPATDAILLLPGVADKTVVTMFIGTFTA